jgi:ABC-2 type transport system permease protein
MNPRLHAVRLGLTRGWIEAKQSFTNAQDLTWIVVVNGIFVVVLAFQRDSTIEGTSLALLTLASLFGMSVAQGGFTGTAGLLSMHREDGTLLRAKAIPNGILGYLVAQIVTITVTTLVGIAITLTAGLLLVDGVTTGGPGGWLTLAWVIGLGLLATLPWGAVVGSFAKSSASGFGLSFLPIIGLVAISGIFYPITALPGWVQGLAQAFPVYWLGLGTRSVLLPDSAVGAELGDSWRLWETAAVLGVWAAVGIPLALAVLRRMARRESGSAMQDRMQRALHRGY